MTTLAAEDRERVGPYRVIRAIGAGGSSRVDIARIDRAYGFQRHVVIKRPLEHLRGNAQVAASLRREARIGGRLHHPNLVAILDAGVHDGYDYLVLEYVHGCPLRTLMHSDAPGQVRELPLPVALAIVCDVARGMHEAHELTGDAGSPLGLVHRDVSPGNILLGFDGSVKLADFGIAKETRVSTLSGSVHGTVTYMAPEQCQGHAFDRRADVFSLGVILYELVTGARLFWADNDVASLHRVLSGSVPRPRKVNPQLPGALEDIVMTAVAHDAGKRYPTALALATALERHAASTGAVLGARWIARAIADVLGVKQAPWIGAAAMPETAQRSDGSLVELIAAAEPDEPDEPLPPSFGDSDESVALDESAPGSASLAPIPRSPRRARRLAAAAIALAVFGGAAIAVMWTQGPGAAEGTQAGTEDTPATEDTPENTPAAEDRPAPKDIPATDIPATDMPAPPVTASSEPDAPSLASPDSPVAPSASGPAPASPTRTGKRRRRPRPASGAAAAASPPIPAIPAPSSSQASPAPASPAGGNDVEPTPAAAAASEPPPPPPAVKPAPVNVQWKPTLLLPTDGSARNRK